MKGGKILKYSFLTELWFNFFKENEMQKRFTILVWALASFGVAGILSAQATHTVGFESEEDGTGWEWTVTENGDNPALEFVANPNAAAPNSSANVAKFTARSAANGGQKWALCLTTDDGEFTFDASNSTVKMMVYKPVASDVAVKFEGTSGAIEIKVANTLVNQWEELVYDFSGQIGNTYNKLVIIPDYVSAVRTQDNICYFDNVQVPDGTPAAPVNDPTTAAPTPTHSADDVFSIFSGTYTDLAGSNFNPGWGQSTAQSFETLEGDSVLKYASFNYQGTNLGSENGGVPQDVSGYDYLHIDFWTPNATALNFFLIDQTDGEVSYSLPITKEQWVSVEIPLSHFTNGGENLADIHQFKVAGGDGAKTVVWFDNWYFYKSASVAEPTEAVPTPTHSADKVISLFSDAYTNVTVDTWSASWDKADVNTIAIAGDSVQYYSNLTHAGIEFTSQTIDASGMTHFHMDIWTPDSTDLPKVFKIKLVDFGANGVWDGGGDDVEHEVALDANAGLTTGSWVSFDLPLTDFTGLTTQSHLAQLIISGDPNTVYVDNVYLYDDGTTIEQVGTVVPGEFGLMQNYPNPFNPTTTISFNLPQSNEVELKVFNLLGQELLTLVKEYKQAGVYELIFDASALPTGVYIYSIKTGNYTAFKKMTLVK
jgi:hypothetical protein